MIDRPTIEVYERGARHYVERRKAYAPEAAAAFAASVDGVRLDLGCGPGHYVPHLGTPLVCVDAAHAMLREVRDAPTVQADVAELPFRRSAAAGAWVSKTYQHLPHEALPLALAELHRVLEVGALVVLTVFAGDGSLVTDEEDDLPGRLFSLWSPERFTDVLVGAGFSVDGIEALDTGWPQLRVSARRERSLADTVGPGMRLLVCGLNPSLYAADAGLGFARPGNRFWPALLAAGLAEVDRDPRALLRRGVGMTDLVKRATVAADELSGDEYAEGVERVRRLCEWLRPGALYTVGLAGWRAAVDRKATPGWQDELFGGVPVYLGPSTSGLNASTQLDGHVAHLRAAVSGR